MYPYFRGKEALKFFFNIFFGYIYIQLILVIN